MDWVREYGSAFLSLWSAMAPWLIIGFVCAALLAILIRAEWVMRHLGGHGLGPIFKATVAGVPLPLCSCGVIPVAAGLHGRGSSAGATAAFTAATPQTGVDSIAATWGMLGPVFAGIRVAVALVSGWLAGWLVDKVDGRKSPAQTADNGETPPALSGNLSWSEGMRFGLLTLPKDLTVPMVIGIAAASAITTFVPSGWLDSYLSNPALAYLAVTLLAIPLYVCSVGTIPLAVGLVFAGASPGTALVLLIAGPATNAATITAMIKLLGGRATTAYLAAVIGTSWIAAFIFDSIGGKMGEFSHHSHLHLENGVLNLVSGWLIAGMILAGWLWPRPKSAKACCGDSAAARDCCAAAEPPVTTSGCGCGCGEKKDPAQAKA